MKEVITLYHGSDKVVQKPQHRLGKKNNDYGQGLYCTEHYDLACEWASKIKGKDGFVNTYELDLNGLRILDLADSAYNILNWITILLKNRTFDLSSPISVSAKEYLVNNFDIDISEYDIIKGYRADDSYFSFAEDFLNNTISVQHLSRAMKLGKLGIQYALISEKAFEQLIFISSEPIDNQKYYPLYAERDYKARQSYKNTKTDITVNSDDIFMLDIIRENIKNGDSRI